MARADRNKNKDKNKEPNYKTIKFGGKVYRVYTNGDIKQKSSRRAKQWTPVTDEVIIDRVLKNGGQDYIDSKSTKVTKEDKAIADATSASPDGDLRGLPDGYRQTFRVIVGSPEDQRLQDNVIYSGSRKVIGNTAVYNADAGEAWKHFYAERDEKLKTDPDYILESYKNGGLSPLAAIDLYAEAAGVSKLKARSALGIKAGEFGTVKGEGEGVVTELDEDGAISKPKAPLEVSTTDATEPTSQPFTPEEKLSPEQDKYYLVTGLAKNRIAAGEDAQTVIQETLAEVRKIPGYEDYSALRIRKDMDVKTGPKGPLAGAVDTSKFGTAEQAGQHFSGSGGADTGDLQGATSSLGLTHGTVTSDHTVVDPVTGEKTTGTSTYDVGTEGALDFDNLPGFNKGGMVKRRGPLWR